MKDSEPEVPEVCPIEKALLDSGVTVSNDWLCPECEGVHRAIIPKLKVPESVKDLLLKAEIDEYHPREKEKVEKLALDAYLLGQKSK